VDKWQKDKKMKPIRENSCNSWAKKIIKTLDSRKFEKGKRTQFYLNIAAGLIMVFLIMPGLESTRWGESLLNSAFDRFIASEAKAAVKTNEDPGELLLLDIGFVKKNGIKEKEAEGKTNFLSPRDTIARLLTMAFTGNASVVVLDFALEENDCCHPERDEQLRKVLADNTNKRTKVIFPVRTVCTDSTCKYEKIQPLIFDAEIDQNPNYTRAASTLLASPEDAVVRHWKVFHQYKEKEDALKKILWSLPVLAVALQKDKEKDLKNLEALLETDNKIAGYSLDFNNTGEKKELFLPLQETDPYRQRIRFRLIPKDCIDGSPEGNIRVTAAEYLKPEGFKNKIVIIGNSDPAVGDVLSTPVGNMPGMYIQTNAIHTLLEGFQPKSPPWWVSVLINLFIIIGAAYLFHYTESFLMDLMVWLIGIFGFGALGYYCFFKSYGIVPNYVFGIAAIGYIEIMNSLKDLLVKNKKKNSPQITQINTDYILE